jgi:hypothetical protein
MKVGDRVKVSWHFHGKTIFDRKGKPVDMQGFKYQVVGTIYYVGPELPNGTAPSAIVVRCSRENNIGFSFYPHDTEHAQKIEVLESC